MMSAEGMTRVVHCKREPYDVYIGRPGPWGNPYPLRKGMSREQVIAQYRAWIVEQPELMNRIHELRGKVLGCWCAPLACHGNVLVELANCSENVVDTFCKKEVESKSTSYELDADLFESE